MPGEVGSTRDPKRDTLDAASSQGSSHSSEEYWHKYSFYKYFNNHRFAKYEGALQRAVHVWTGESNLVSEQRKASLRKGFLS